MPNNFMTLKNALRTQKLFSNRIYDPTDDPEVLTQRMKHMVLGLQAEAVDLLKSVKFRDHVIANQQIDQDKILYESVDVFRYILAILNNWDISAEEFAAACKSRDSHLHIRKDFETRKWNGTSPVVIVDLDDVVGEFRQRFIDWIDETYSVKLDRENDQYYSTSELIKEGLNPEDVYSHFIQERQVTTIPIIESAVQCMKVAKELGCYVQILTARPEENARLCYDTYTWLKEHDVMQYINAIAFSGEKFRWAMKQPWYNSKHLVCAIDDSPKHAGEFASHEIRTLMPITNYNKDLVGTSNIVGYDPKSPDDLERSLRQALKDYHTSRVEASE